MQQTSMLVSSLRGVERFKLMHPVVAPDRYEYTPGFRMKPNHRICGKSLLPLFPVSESDMEN
ncbi:unnamed protein product [Diplocarpon coronariae]